MLYMFDIEINRIADEANMIFNGYAFTVVDDKVKVLNLNNPEQACVLTKEGEMISSNMDEITLNLVQAYYLKNIEFMG